MALFILRIGIVLFCACGAIIEFLWPALRRNGLELRWLVERVFRRRSLAG